MTELLVSACFINTIKENVPELHIQSFVSLLLQPVQEDIEKDAIYILSCLCV